MPAAATGEQSAGNVAAGPPTRGVGGDPPRTVLAGGPVAVARSGATRRAPIVGRGAAEPRLQRVWVLGGPFADLPACGAVGGLPREADLYTLMTTLLSLAKA